MNPDENDPEQSPQTSASEEPSSQTPSEETSGEGSVKIPEEFQKKVDALIYGANTAQLNYIRDCVIQREKTLMKSETKPEKGGDFDVDGMPE